MLLTILYLILLKPERCNILLALHCNGVSYEDEGISSVLIDGGLGWKTRVKKYRTFVPSSNIVVLSSIETRHLCVLLYVASKGPIA